MAAGSLPEDGELRLGTVSRLGAGHAPRDRAVIVLLSPGGMP
jgi:hypothetical protein